MHMKQSPYQLHPQQFLSSSSSFYIMLHMCILCCVSSFEKKTSSEKYEWESLLLLSELSISALPSHCLDVQELRWVHDTTKCYRFVRFVRYHNYRTIVNIDYATVRYETNDTVE